MIITKVKSGEELLVPVYSGEKNGGQFIRYDHYIVEKVYPYHVLAFNGMFYQSFTLGELVQMGLEDGHNIESHGPGSTGNAWRLYHKGKDQIEAERKGESL